MAGILYALLPNKQHATYNRTFMTVKEAVLNFGLELTPSSVLSDFEQALINSIRLNFPTAQHRGCYYHYSQAIWQKVQALGLQEEYKAEVENSKIFCTEDISQLLYFPSRAGGAGPVAQAMAGPIFETCRDFSSGHMLVQARNMCTCRLQAKCR